MQAQALLASVLNRLEGLLDTLLREGFAPLQAAYLDAWLHTGQQVYCNTVSSSTSPGCQWCSQVIRSANQRVTLQVVLEEGEGPSKQQVPLTIRGLTGSGYLSATDAQGEHYELHPDGNRQDCLPVLECV